jgi:hypothetical protein
VKINITYPVVSKTKHNRRRFLKLMKWIFILLALASIIVNICVGGLLWFPVALMGLFMIWNLILSIDLVEYNRISQFIKATIYSCILMVLIDIFLVSGWALDVISIVSFASVIISGILFFTDFNRQKQNMLPMFYLITIALIWSMVGLFSALEVMSWPLIVLGGVTLLLLAVIIITLRGDFIRELKCRFHLK